MQVFMGGAWRTITSVQAYINGAWRTIVNGKSFSGGAWRDICNFTPVSGPPAPMTLAVSPSSSATRFPASTFSSGAITATPSGGAAPYTYVWSIVSSVGSASFSLTTPTLANTAVRVSGLATAVTATCSIHCVCHDSTGLTATSAAASLSFFNSTSGAAP